MEKNLTNIKEYFEEVKNNYPTVNFETFKEICLTPFKFVKEVMSSGSLKNIRLQYLGNFEVSSSRVKFSKKVLTKNYEEGKIDKERYLNRINTLKNYED